MAGVTLPRLEGEDRTRSGDRARVFAARAAGSRWRLLWLLVGPGLLAMLGENDGPSMISYATSGATYGIPVFGALLIVTFGMAYVVQEMAMRVGTVTHRGFGELVLQRYGRLWGWFGAGDLALTNLVTLIAEFVAIRVGLAHFGIGPGWAAALGLVLVLFTLSGGRYWRWERIVLGLALFNGLFLVAGVLVAAHGAGGAMSAAASSTSLGGGSLRDLLLLVASTVGATVTPWMVFFQTSASADKGLTPHDLRQGRFDTIAGAIAAALFGLGALVAGAALFGHGGASLASLGGIGFPDALHDHVGAVAGTAFALGLVEAGAVAILTISASTAYAVGECVGVTHSFNSTPRGAAVFHSVNVGGAALAAVVILVPGAPLLEIVLNANVLATALLPVALVFLIMLASDRALMGRWGNGRATNAVSGAIVVLVGCAAAAYAGVSFVHAVAG